MLLVKQLWWSCECEWSEQWRQYRNSIQNPWPKRQRRRGWWRWGTGTACLEWHEVEEVDGGAAVRRAEYMVWAKGEWPNMENGNSVGPIGPFVNGPTAYTYIWASSASLKAQMKSAWHDSKIFSLASSCQFWLFFLTRPVLTLSTHPYSRSLTNLLVETIYNNNNYYYIFPPPLTKKKKNIYNNNNESSWIIAH